MLFRSVDSGLACVHPFHALEMDVPSKPPATLADAGIAPATAPEVASFLASIERSRPWAYREAFDLVPERFDLRSVSQLWTDAGFKRERDLLAAHDGSRLLAVALVESADPGLHLFNLLDVVRLYALVPGGEARFPALLDAAAAWFGLRGRSSFSCLLEEGTPGCAAHLAARDLGPGNATILSSELLPSFLEHVSEVTAPRLPPG